MKPVAKVGIGLLYFNKDLPQFERCLERMQFQLWASGLVTDIQQIPRSNKAVDMARNEIVHEAFRMGLDAVIWLDTDMIYPDTALVDLVRMCNAGHPVAAGIYRRGRFPFEILTQREGGEWSQLDDLREHADGGVTRVKLTAGGYSITHIDAYKAVSAHMLKTTGRPVPWYCNWDFVGEAGQCGEDTFFMVRLAEAGVPVVVDPDLHAVHWNVYGPIPVVDDQPEMEYCQ